MMDAIQIVVISHGPTSTYLLKTVQQIVDNGVPMQALHFDTDTSPESHELDLGKLLETFTEQQRILLLVDVIGATPCNVCRKFIDEGRVALVSGYNLPMLLKLATLREQFDNLEALALFIRDYGRKAITVEA